MKDVDSVMDPVCSSPPNECGCGCLVLGLVHILLGCLVSYWAILLLPLMFSELSELCPYD